MRAVVLTLASCLGACAAATSSEMSTPEHAFGGSVRAPLAVVREDLLVPHAYTGTGLGFALDYAAAIGDGVLRADLALGARYVLARNEARALVFDHGLRLRHTFTIGRGAWSVGLGPALGWETDVAYYETWDDAHAYWLTDRWLGLAATTWHRLDACWRLDLEAELMLVALESRNPGPPDYKQDPLDEVGFFFSAPQRDVRFGWLGETQRLRLAADLWRSRASGALASGWALGAQVRTAHTSWPEPMALVELSFRFTWMWGLP